MIQARQMLVKSNKFNIKCPNVMVAEYITIHNTANDSSADNEIQYMINNSAEVSYHFAVDDKEVVQGIRTDRNTWAAGDGGNGPGNRKSIHVEICYSQSGGERYKKAEALAIKFVAQMLLERGWGIERVKKHQDWSGKYCPHRILAEGRWQAVLNAVQAELNGLKKSNEKKENAKMQKVNIVAGTKLLEGVVINGVTYAPVRELSELLGKKVEWNEKTSMVTLK
ncbi:N-acetylmuramoyl-L-alanine amidase [Schinkia sp. CFF1]